MDDLHNAWLIALALGIPLGIAVNEAGQHFTKWWNDNRPPPPDTPHHYPGAH